MGRMRTVCFRIPETLLKSINELAEKLGYTSRSDLIRDAIRALLREKARGLIMSISAEGTRKESKIIEEVKIIE
jgi:metal-responsive CopG/Arc/MetJ family transcriptional regulator